MNRIGTRPIETDRLILRRFTMDDVADAFHHWFSDPDVAMYMRWDAHTDSSQTKEFLSRFVTEYEKNDFYRWAITLKKENKAIGAIGFHVESEFDSVADISYTLGKAFWNRGIITEALQSVLRYALVSVGINRIEAFHAIHNPASGMVMRKAGMQYEGRARQKYRSHRGLEDCDLYALLREDLTQRKDGERMPHSIAIDGPVGAGKSSVAKGVAQALGFPYLDTGAMYRALGLKVLRAGRDPQDERAATWAAESSVVSVRFENGVQRTLLDDEDVTELLRTPEAGNAASAVSQWPVVRALLVREQRDIASRIDMVLDGRDIGTVVLPNATLKIFLTADAEVRAKRRFDELIAAGNRVEYEGVLADLLARDAQDSGRAADPLRQADDAVLVDTTGMTLPQVIEHIVGLYRGRVGF
ncbi:MAG: (d)CMP kinase [Clostridia bacterium]|nr:(d)CMP kinase [Clostridia bacterium]